MADLIRMSLLGTMPNGEEWSVNPAFRLNASPLVTPAELTALVNAIDGITYPTTLAALHSSTTRLTGVRVEARESTGELQAFADKTFGTGFAGTGSSVHPFQTSAVFSLRTPLGGASGRGRCYWPATGVALDTSTLRMASSVVTSALGGFRTLMTTLEGLVTTHVDEAILGVWSRRLNTVAGVTSIQIGDVADTQRRRRDAVPEGYTTLAYPS